MDKKHRPESLTMKEAIAEASRCLKCKKPLCKEHCPIGNDIPDFMLALSKGNIGEAKEIIVAKSNLPAVCGRICPHEKQCEGNCILNKKGDPILVGLIEQFIADFEFDMNLTGEKLAPKTRGKVVVIGSGPAGLTVAGDLARRGFQVTVYESSASFGGILTYEIPEFRLPKYVVNREIERIETLGVNFVSNVMVGKDITVDEIFAQGNDAIFIGTGAPLGKKLDIEGKDLYGVFLASFVLRMNHLYHDGYLARDAIDFTEADDVLVIGGGNVAMDAARTIARFGAKKVTVLYHREKEAMGALKAEIEGALEDGVTFTYNTSPLRFIGENDTLTGMIAKQDGKEVLIPCTKAVLAVGFRPANRIVSTTKGIEIQDNGYVITEQHPYGMTTRRGVFAGGDVVHQPATVVLAMREAKKVAEGIAEYVDAVNLLGLDSEAFRKLKSEL